MSTDTNFYQNIHHMRDGRIMLYTRADTKRDTYQARMNVPGMGYVTRSCKTENKRDAIEFADELYSELKYKIKHNIPVKDRNWSKVYEEYHKVLEQRVAQKDIEQSRITRVDSCWKNWLSKHWGELTCSSLSQEQMDSYWDFRATKEARSTTLHDEADMLNPIFKFALRQGYINRLIIDHKPRVKRVVERQGAFSAVQLRDMLRFTRKWHKSNTHMAQTIYNRQLLHYFILVNINCGLRVGEMFNLKWRDITSNGNGPKIVVTKGKTGPRVTGPQPCIKGYLDKWREITVHTDDDDYVFPHFKGAKMKAHTLGTIFAQMLELINMKTDEMGQKLVLYSLRHTYATNRLRAGAPHYFLIKVMGTSLAMLQKHYDHIMIEDHFDEITKR